MKLTKAQRDVLAALQSRVLSANGLSWRVPNAPARESSITRTCRALIAHGLVEFTTSPFETDFSQRFYRITEAGRLALQSKSGVHVEERKF